MVTHITHLLRRTRAKRSRRSPNQQPGSPGTDVSSWSAATLQALAQACAMGLLMPPPPNAPRERQDTP